MIKVYYIDLSKIELDNSYIKLLSQNRIDKLLNSNPVFFKQGVITELLVSYLFNQLKIPHHELNLKYDEQGCPNYHHSYHVSISHSKDLITVCLTKDKFGLDAQVVKDKYQQLGKIIYNDDEKKVFKNISLDVCNVFSAKEAVLKLLSIGLNVSLKSITIINNIATFNKKQFFLNTVKISVNNEPYFINMASHTPFKTSLKNVNIKKFINYINEIGENYGSI